MTNQDDDLKDLWRSAKESVPKDSADINSVIGLAETKKSNTVRFQIINILILTATMVVIAAFFRYVAPLRELLSHIGITLMIGGLAARITIELYSIYLSSKVDLSETALKTTDQVFRFYRFRKVIHSPVTITIVALYTIGFYLLTPEFSRYFSLPMMALIDGSYVVGAIVLIWQIRKGIRKEMLDLKDIHDIQTNLRTGA